MESVTIASEVIEEYFNLNEATKKKSSKMNIEASVGVGQFLDQAGDDVEKAFELSAKDEEQAIQSARRLLLMALRTATRNKRASIRNLEFEYRGFSHHIPSHNPKNPPPASHSVAIHRIKVQGPDEKIKTIKGWMARQKRG